MSKRKPPLPPPGPPSPPSCKEETTLTTHPVLANGDHTQGVSSAQMGRCPLRKKGCGGPRGMHGGFAFRGEVTVSSRSHQ